MSQPVSPAAYDRLTMQQQAFLTSEAGRSAELALIAMEKDPKYNTQTSFSSRQTDRVPFVERHMVYLSQHLKLDPRHYVANLRLMTKIKH